MKCLTGRQREVLDFIARFTEENLFPPTVREIGEHFGISLRAVQDHVAALQKKGYLSLCQKRSRSIRVLKDGAGTCLPGAVKQIPVVEYSDAGKTVDLSRPNDFFPCAASLLNAAGSYFAVKVPDSSMTGSGIFRGDTAVVESADSVPSGRIALVAADGRMELCRLSEEEGMTVLCYDSPVAENKKYPGQEVKILGFLVAVFRTY